MKSDSLLPYIWMLCASFSFAVMAACAHALGPRCDWRVIASFRTGLALLFAAVLVWRAGVKFVVWRPRTLWVRSIAGTVSLFCMYYALTRMPIADVMTLQNVFPIWVALLSWPVLGEMPAGDAWVAIAVALVGVLMVEQPHFAEGGQAAAAAALTSSATTAISMLGLHRLHHLDPRAIVVHFSAVALAACLASLVIWPPLASDRDIFHNGTLAMLFGVGLAGTIGQLFLTKAFAAGPPARVSVVALTQVGFGMLFDVAVWGHTFGPVTLAGITLVMAPTAWMLVSKRRPAAEPVDDV